MATSVSLDLRPYVSPKWGVGESQIVFYSGTAGRRSNGHQCEF